MTPGPVPSPPTRVVPRPARSPAAGWVAPTRPEPLLRRLVGAAFRRHRDAQRRTLADVAGTARISIAYLSEIERGRKEPSSEVLVAVCRALGIRLADLLAEAAAELRAADVRDARRRALPPGAVGATARPSVVELSAVAADGEREPVRGPSGAAPSRPRRADADAYLCVA